jgi:hypothetical protein
VLVTSVVGFISVLVGRWLQLDYSAKLYVMTFVLVVMAAEHSSGVIVFHCETAMNRAAAWPIVLEGAGFGLPPRQTPPLQLQRRPSWRLRAYRASASASSAA